MMKTMTSTWFVAAIATACATGQQQQEVHAVVDALERRYDSETGSPIDPGQIAELLEEPASPGATLGTPRESVPKTSQSEVREILASALAAALEAAEGTPLEGAGDLESQIKALMLSLDQKLVELADSENPAKVAEPATEAGLHISDPNPSETAVSSVETLGEGPRTTTVPQDHSVPGVEVLFIRVEWIERRLEQVKERLDRLEQEAGEQPAVQAPEAGAPPTDADATLDSAPLPAEGSCP
jgi:hypothetical protein